MILLIQATGQVPLLNLVRLVCMPLLTFFYLTYLTTGRTNDDSGRKDMHVNETSLRMEEMAT